MNPSDLDTLADYVEGLLDGTPEAEAVAAKIAEDPAWADTYSQLTRANPAVTAALAGLADPPVPPSVSANLRSALAAERPAADEDDADIIATPTPLRHPEHGKGIRVAAWLAAACVVALALVGGISQLSKNTSSDDSASSSAGSAPKAVRASASADPDHVRVTGTAYAATQFGPQVRALVAQTPATEVPVPGATTKAPSGQTTEAPNSPATAAPSVEAAPAQRQIAASLRRLAAPDALNNCLSTFGGFDPLAVDYATYNGRPAVVVVTVGDNARELHVTVVGPGCGINGRSDILNSVTVGR
jgi:hypothetical protein